MIKIGILGSARIVPWAMIHPANRRDDVIIHAIAASRPGKAKEFANEHGIAVVHDSYDALIADPDIDVIYNPLPPAWHAKYTIKALNARKHVLCEKPFAMNATEAMAMNEAAKRNGVRVVEAFHDHYHPVFQYALTLRKSGRLGKIKTVEAVFNHTIPYDEAEFRHHPHLGGGALMDLGCYPVRWCRNIIGEEPKVVSAVASLTAQGADEEITANFSFKSGAKASIEARMTPGWEYHARLSVNAENGSVTLVNSLLPHLGHSIIESLNGGLKEFTLAGGTTFDYQLDQFVTALRTGNPMATEGANPIGNMTTIDAIYAAAGVQRDGLKRASSGI